MFFFIIIGAVLALIAVGVVSCYGLWKELAVPNFLYWIVVAVLIFVTLFTAMNSKKIPTKPLREICIFISAVFFIVMIYGSMLFALRGIILLVGKLCHANNGFFAFLGNRKKTIPLIIAVTMLTGLAGYVNMGIIRVTNFNVSLSKTVNSKVKSMTAAVISDMHIGIADHKSAIDTIVKKVNDMKADTVFLVGDIFDESTTTEEMEYFRDSFSRIESTYGTYYVLGNHEGYRGSDTTKYFTDAGITVLRDNATVLENGVTLIGLRDQYDGERKDIASIISDEKVDLSTPVLMLKHEPLELKSYADAGVDLSFSGHTHGEQFPFTMKLFSLANDMMYGQEKFGSMTAITTSGAGGWGFHFKLPAKSEIAKVNITFGE